MSDCAEKVLDCDRISRVLGAKAMQIEDYFEFISKDEIRLRGTRVGIEAILTEYAEGALRANSSQLSANHLGASARNDYVLFAE
jgi:hypothetical protein